VTVLFTCLSVTSIEGTGGSDIDDDDDIDNNNNNNNVNNKHNTGKKIYFYDSEIHSENLSPTNSSIKISHMMEVASTNIQKSLNKRLLKFLSSYHPQ